MPDGLRFLRLWQAIGAALIALVIHQSLTVDPLEIPAAPGNLGGHLVAYATLMAWFSQIDLAARRRCAWALAFVLLGAALEFLQGQTGYRTFDPADMVANAAGVGAGWLAAPPRLPRLLAGADTLLTRVLRGSK
ncbi:MAG: VanZ family protein [Burkholderiales bacterium]|nr:VanZ family protein [Burkholderiales bacterium]